MKMMTCRQLGGACDKEFYAETFEELEAQAKQHAMEMFAAQDPDHMAAMAKMAHLMQDPAAMEKWINERRAEFEALPEID